MTDLKALWKNEYFKTAVAILLIVAVVLGFIFGLQFALHTSYPALTVESGSMSVPYDALDYNFWLNLQTPFDRTLSVGDIIIVQGVNPKSLNADYPNSDIIVFHEPGNPNELIVHRITSEVNENNTLYFYTKGDGNLPAWPTAVAPQTPDYAWADTPAASAYYQSHPDVPVGSVPQSMVVGKVVMRIPLMGWVTLFLNLKQNPFALPVIIGIIMLLIIVEFIVPILREKKPEQQEQPKPQMSL